MLKTLQKLFGGDSNDRELKKLWPVVEEINEHADRLQSLTDEELQAKTAEFKARIREAVAPIEQEQAELRARLRAAGDDAPAASGDGQTAAREALSVRERQDLYADLDDLEGDWLDAAEDVLEDILPEAFAVVKETCRRFVGKSWEAGGTTVEWQMVPYDVQLLGGIVLHRGSVAEMRTGEGKTLTAVAPLYLNALVGRGAHVVTVNPYLAQRDAEWMAPIFGFHGMTVDCIDKYKAHTPGRRAAYRADITYGTNNEYGFDYLRDNSFVVEADQLVQREHHYAIVDEVDSVLIDEARTPLIISGPVPQGDTDEYQEFNPYVERLVRDQQKLVAGYVMEAERKLSEADAQEASGDKKAATRLREEAGLALLRAQRGYPRNKKLIKMKGEPGVELLIRKIEGVYLQDSAKRMPEVDEPLHFALEEKMHQLEMTDKGREFIAKQAGTDTDFWVIPDMGSEVAEIEREYETRKAEMVEALKTDSSLDDEKRQNKLQNDLAVLKNETEEKKRQLYTAYSERSERIHAVNQLLRGYTLYEKDVEYVVEDGKVMIVDEHTGRVLGGRRYSDGLHQAIEAKEKVKVQASTQTYATITIQNYFRLYSKLAGMTGTAETEAEEFDKIYKLPVIVVPTNKPVIRDDREDWVYKTKRAKLKAVLEVIREYHEKGQPVLVGTASVESSETIARLLQLEKIPHHVLNAKASRAASEAEIVAEAGKRGAVTIATNMAGRGTDIKLGEGVKEMGGLAIIGTERHESRRIDNQLRGRAGRQGDPGVSRFYVSLEDDLMRLFGHDRTARIMDKLGMEEDEVIEHKWITKGIERSQTKVEQNNFAIRKRQLEYDDVLNAQREVIYDRRMHALSGERLRGDILDMLRGLAERIVGEHFASGDIEEIQEDIRRTLAFELDVDQQTAYNLGEGGLVERILDEATAHYRRKRAALARPFYESARQMIENTPEGAEAPKRFFVDFSDGRRVLRAMVQAEDVLATEGQEINDALERSAVLSTIDSKWTEHLRDLDEVKEGVGLRAYGQKDPLIEYKMEAYRLFKEMITAIDEDVVGLVFKAGPLIQGDSQGQAARRVKEVSKPRLDERRATTQHAAGDPNYAATFGASGASGQSSAEKDPTVKADPVVVGEQIGRNDKCPCGSGKKYKHCHGRG
ncbi:SEC-C metal-binding domain-containing protein [Rubricoccus marinus]|uniref:Protein translocase subunit SecA n=1 Tax=Rubricoccus marinus TaxID=716817 RepID=A0A259TYV2_9BACT|nr:SEC-C metal-binding domain-containing protein [Rubricoccus marinus]OZC02955.1 preprotein translocase subunit SecA [Rubricoccus marinus]